VSIPLAALVTLFVISVVPLLPTEPVLAAMGVLAATNHTTPALVIAVAAVGCSISDHLIYALGRATGARVLARLRRKASVDTAANWLRHNAARWGTTVLIAGRWLPGGGTVGAVLAGTLRWRLTRFTPASVIGCTLWSAYVAMIGYLGGSIAGEPAVGLLLSLAVAGLTTGLGSVLLQRAGRRLETHEAA
jgi:membrane protein DedA with SNARE-associated domain